MNVSYDAKVDALYIKLFPSQDEVQTKEIDDDIYLNFDEKDRLVGIEVLDASKRVDLSYLLPTELRRANNGAHSKRPRSDKWRALAHTLLEFQRNRVPVETRTQRRKNWVAEVGVDYVKLRQGDSGNIRRISKWEFEEGTDEVLKRRRKLAITLALRDMAA